MILLIADLHLQMEKPEIISRFLRFLYEKAIAADALYILGDLFDIWIGDDNTNLMYYKVAYALKKLVNSGVPCYFIHGNHDFLIGQNFARESGITLLPEIQVIKPYGHKVLIMHGDTLCINDRRYQALRAKVRAPWVQKLFLSLPLFIRNNIAKKVRASSKNRGKSCFIKDINLQTVIEVMKKYHVQWLIYGHIHYPYIYEFVVNNQSAFCITLGAWHRDGSMVKMTPEKIELVRSFN